MSQLVGSSQTSGTSILAGFTDRCHLPHWEFYAFTIAIKGGGGILGCFGPSEAGGFRSTMWLAEYATSSGVSSDLVSVIVFHLRVQKILPCFFEILRWEVNGVCSYLKAKWIHYLASSKDRRIFKTHPSLTRLISLLRISPNFFLAHVLP